MRSQTVRTSSRSPALLLASMIILVISLMCFAASPAATAPKPAAEENGTSITTEIAGAREPARLVRSADGRFAYVLQDDKGETLTLTPEQFADRLYHRQIDRSWFSVLMNISSPAGLLWFAIGFFGQVLFTGRMLVQWLASERRGKSVVPPAFWWMSLLGSTMLLTYFLWRRDLVGVLGQGFGWVIYIRNLRLIYRSSNRHEAAAAMPS